MTSAAHVAAAHAAPLHSADHAVEVHLVVAAHVEVVHSHTEEVLTAVVRSLMAEVLMVVDLTDMEVWEAVAKLRAPAHVPQHSSYAAPRS